MLPCSRDITILNYNYSFVDNELDYKLTDLEDDGISDFEFVIYRINTKNKIPFLEFLLHYNSEMCKFLEFKKSKRSNETLKSELDDIIKKLFTTKFRYKGYMYDETTNKYYVFYEIYFNMDYKPYFVSLKEKENWFWVCSTEIINNNSYMNITIEQNLIDMFNNHPQIMVLQRDTENIEMPVVLYTGANFCYTETMSKFGLLREPITSRYGPFYYFTDLLHSFRWGCYDYKNAIILNDLDSKRKDGGKYTSGGITRYAVFAGKMKTVFIDDPYDNVLLTKYKENKTLFENISVPKDANYIEYLDKSPSFHSYDYSWTNEFDTIYNGLYTLDQNKVKKNVSSEYSTIIPFWCKYNYNQFEQLTYYCVDTSNIPVTYDSLFRNYVVL